MIHVNQPGIASSDFHIFRFLSNLRNFPKWRRHASNWLGEFLASKPPDFFRCGMEKLPVEENILYILFIKKKKKMSEEMNSVIIFLA